MLQCILIHSSALQYVRTNIAIGDESDLSDQSVLGVCDANKHLVTREEKVRYRK